MGDLGQMPLQQRLQETGASGYYSLFRCCYKSTSISRSVGIGSSRPLPPHQEPQVHLQDDPGCCCRCRCSCIGLPLPCPCPSFSGASRLLQVWLLVPL